MECKHKETRIKHHSTEYNRPFCTDLVICKDCGEILGLDSINLVSPSDFHESVDANCVNQVVEDKNGD